ncbi:putative transcriptional regulator, GntR family [Methylocella silvestris BL2]|uniref:Putative transcriptional regulator, GntR family n=1 Tax=Methylocella silvestris (strain DSM 15510 / CIP 108128 / LMG 27833 / NCIMB 13906 / BL2) TaxID=395965 RepID=B8EQD2_METSB|nr:aminotransferase class I/II-fold pyridoxal phosphate-dependent enzyme [Methylocella silvestris]ACK52145.1 putative transcriptional regulator, GntR family [Methylocella silvestris BL2]
MTPIDQLSKAELAALRASVQANYDAFRAQGLKLDMTRGKPAPDQLDLANAMLSLMGNADYRSEAGEDARNYGNLQGLAEARALIAPILGAPPEQIVVGDNSSLALMHDSLVYALTKGVPGSARPWAKEESVAFICPAPGYDRHFAICEEYGVRMLPVRMTGEGPDMEEVERLAADPAVKGIWAVPKYSNPTGDIYSDATVARLAAMRTGARDFRIFWDDAYCVHHLTAQRNAVANILEECARAGNQDRAFIFASTSKITLAGAGLAFFASSPANVKWYLSSASKRSIGPDKLNQLRHVRFLRDAEGINAHMDAHRALIAPKFAAVIEALDRHLAGTGAANWSVPQGGYFISVEASAGTARRVVELAKAAGVALTPAGATWPYGKDPDDSNLRLAPTFPTLAEVRAASEGIALCILLAALEARTAQAAESAA